MTQKQWSQAKSSKRRKGFSLRYRSRWGLKYVVVLTAPRHFSILWLRFGAGFDPEPKESEWAGDHESELKPISGSERSSVNRLTGSSRRLTKPNPCPVSRFGIGVVLSHGIADRELVPLYPAWVAIGFVPNLDIRSSTDGV